MSKLPKWMEDELREVEREGLILKHGLEKAEEILLDRELGNLQYVFDEEGEYDVVSS
ncbi:MAG: hypothetical protein IPG22_16480 [Acidobacteria bacterium]|nr:hypothetical protein [Acidobacteriota bacterium]